jgi:chemotaxis protein MotB
MFFARPRNSTRLEVWPTFVDALSTVLMAIVFVLMTFLVAQVFLVETINDRDTELAKLQSQLRQLELNLTKTKDQYQTASLKATALEELIKNLNSQLEKLTQDVTLEKQQHGEQKTLNERIKTDLEKLEERLKQLQNLLSQAQEESLKKDDKVKKLQLNLQGLEKENEKHKNAIKVGQFRSQFFAQLKKILGDRSDVRVVDDRFVFQSEVLFAVGSAELGNDGKKQLDGLVNALKEIGSKIPPEINWILRVDGHTDNRPIKSTQFPSNWELSTARAIAVVQYMIGKGIDGKHLVAAGFGEFQPLNTDKKDIERNRRIEFKLDQR